MAKRSGISVGRLRAGLALFVLWWVPVYLAVPAIVGLLGDDGNAHAEKAVAVIVVTVQSAVGVTGLLLVGRELGSTLRRVRMRRLPAVVWRMVRSGDTTIAPSELKS